MTAVSDVLRARLATQRMLADRLAGPAEVVALLAEVRAAFEAAILIIEEVHR